MRRYATVLAFLAACAAAPARAQTDSASGDDPADWTASIQQSVTADELESATTAVSADAVDGPDPLLALAARHGLASPSWLQQRVREQGGAATLAALGDSVSAGSFSCSGLYCPSNSWSVGDMEASVRRRLEESSGRSVRGLMVAVPSVTAAAMPAEAFAVYLASAFGLDVERMTLLIGHNDPGVCHPDKPGERESFERNISLALDILERVARRRRAKLFVSGMLDVTALTRFENVVPDGAAASCRELWRSTGRCKDLLQRRAEADHLEAVRERVAEDNEVLRRLSAGRDWIVYSDAINAAGRHGIPDPELNLSRYDCFHPSAAGQARLGAAAWDGSAGAPGISGFFELDGPPAVAASRIKDELETWSMR